MKHLRFFQAQMSFVGASALAAIVSSPAAWIGDLYWIGLRAIVLAVGMALTVIIMNLLSEKQPAIGHHYLLATIALSLPAGIAIGALNSLFPQPYKAGDFFSPLEVGWPMMTACALYSVLMLPAYAIGQRMRNKGIAVFMLVTLASIVAGTLKIKFLLFNGAMGWTDSAFASLLSVTPFGALWAWAAIFTDPAYSVERWRRPLIES